jgi:type I restriction enzyme, S subunit
MSNVTYHPLGSMAVLVMGQSPAGSSVSDGMENGLPFLQGSAEFGRKSPRPQKSCNAPAKIVQGGATLISVRAPVGAINLADQDYCIGRGLAGIVAKNVDEHYLHHILVYEAARGLKRVAQGSTFEAISAKDLRELALPFVFDIYEQRKIADILSTVDALIEKSEAVVAKQRRIRCGLVERLVANASRPDVAVIMLEELSSSLTSGSRGWAKYYADEGALFLRIGNLTRTHPNLRLDDVVYVDVPTGAEGARTRVQTGDILVSITADLGIIGCIPATLGEAYVNQHIALVRPRDAEDARWIAHILASSIGQKQVAKLNDSGAKAALNLPAVGGLMVPMPDSSVRRHLASVIDSQDLLTASAERELDKLRLLKAGVMQDLLTGRVRVQIQKKMDAQLAA